MNRTTLLPVTVIAIASLLLVMLAVWAATLATPAAFDIDILAYLAGHRSNMADEVFRRITWAGSIFVLAPIGLVISYLLVKCKRLGEALFFASSFTAAAIAARVLKYFIARERPDVHPVLVETFSVYAFPSVHATQITAFSLALYLVLTRSRPAWRVMAGMVLLLLSIGVLLSRCYLQVHYPSDVIGGGLLGIICAVGCSVLLRKQLK